MHRVVKRSGLEAAALSVAQDLAARDPAIVTALKTAVLDGMDIALEAGLDMERRLALGL